MATQIRVSDGLIVALALQPLKRPIQDLHVSCESLTTWRDTPDAIRAFNAQCDHISSRLSFELANHCKVLM